MRPVPNGVLIFHPIFVTVGFFVKLNPFKKKQTSIKPDKGILLHDILQSIIAYVPMPPELLQPKILNMLILQNTYTQLNALTFSNASDTCQDCISQVGTPSLYYVTSSYTTKDETFI